MNRKNYKRILQQKNRNKKIMQGILLLSFGVVTGFISQQQVQASEWTPNISTTIKQGDKEYKIVWGDYLELISNESGLTIDTLVKLNNILDANLIYEGNVVEFGNGATAKVLDSNGNTVAETPLTEKDKQGIAEKNQSNTNKKVNSNETNSATTTKTGSATNTVNNNNGKTNVSKPVEKPSPDTPVVPPVGKPVTPPVELPPIENPETPEKGEVTVKITHILRTHAEAEGGYSQQEEITAKDGEEIILKARDYKGYKVVDEAIQTIKATKDAEVIFNYIQIDKDTTFPEDMVNAHAFVNYVDEDGNKLADTKELGIMVGLNVEAHAKHFEGYTLTSDDVFYGIGVDGMTFTFEYKKDDSEIPQAEKGFVEVDYLDENGNKITDSKVYEGVVGEEFLILAEKLDGYDLADEAEISGVYKNETQTYTFNYKKVPTTPEIKDVTMTVEFLTEYGQTLGTETLTAKEGESVTVKAKAFDGFEIAEGEDSEQTVVATQGEVITFFYAESTGSPIQNVDVSIQHFTTEGEYLDGRVETVKEGETVTATAETFAGYHLVGNATQSVVAKQGASITFKYEKDVVVAQDVTVNVYHVGSDGKTLATSQIVAKEGDTVTAKAQSFKGYTLNDNSSKSVTAFEGATIEFNYAKDVVTPPTDWEPRPTSNSELASGDWNGVWYDDQVGNSGMTFATEEQAEGWAREQPGTGWWTYEVRMKGTNEIRVTVDLY